MGRHCTGHQSLPRHWCETGPNSRRCRNLQNSCPSPVTIGYTGFIGDVLKVSQSINIAIQPITRAALIAVVPIVNAGDEPVEVAITIVITHGIAHTIFIRDNSRCRIDKCLAGLVAQHLTTGEVTRQEHVGVTI